MYSDKTSDQGATPTSDSSTYTFIRVFFYARTTKKLNVYHTCTIVINPLISPSIATHARTRSFCGLIMPTSSPMKKTIELHANTSTPHGATIRLTVEYRSKVNRRIQLIYPIISSEYTINQFEFSFSSSFHLTAIRYNIRRGEYPSARGCRYGSKG